MTRRRVFLAGEGPSEIGNAAAHPSYAVPAEPGVLHALLDHTLPERWELAGAVEWKDIRKFKAGGHASAESRNVLGLALKAREAKADLLVFVRDRDGDRQRERDIHAAIADVANIAVVGGVAVESIEAWVLALCGEPDAEAHQQPKTLLPRHGIHCTADMVECIREKGAAIAQVSAPSLRRWLDQLAKVQQPGA